MGTQSRVIHPCHRRGRAPRCRAGAGCRDMEASFLSIMLREAGVGAPRGTFGGGSGEEQFTSFLTDALRRKDCRKRRHRSCRTPHSFSEGDRG